jgi:hypothetical protein
VRPPGKGRRAHASPRLLEGGHALNEGSEQLTTGRALTQRPWCCWRRCWVPPHCVLRCSPCCGQAGAKLVWCPANVGRRLKRLCNPRLQSGWSGALCRRGRGVARRRGPCRLATATCNGNSLHNVMLERKSKFYVNPC